MKEIFKDIKGYEGLYQVSNLGRVKSLNYNHSKKEKILKNSQCGDYYTVQLYKNGKGKTRLVHCLVAETFIPNPNNYPCVNHKKELEKGNNSIENLEWCTYKYNNNYGTHKQRVGRSHWKKVIQYDLQGNVIKEWESLISIENELNFNHRNISACCNHKYGRPTAYGYKWEYAERVRN